MRKKKKDKEIITDSKEKTTKETLHTETENSQAELPEEKDCCKEEIQTLNDKYLRLFAEFENFRKRTLKEKEELYKMASSKVITALLPVVDDFDRAIDMMKKTDDVTIVKEGIEIVFKKLHTVLAQQGVKQIETKGQEFNTDFHEAITLVETSKDKKDTVIDEVEKGYLLNGQVIRYAKVVVGK